MDSAQTCYEKAIEIEPYFFDALFNLGSIHFNKKSLPQYPGGVEEMYRFMKKTIRYPEISMKNGIQGRVYVTFIVEEDGNLSNIRILRGLDEACNNEVIRLVKSMPKWEPARDKSGANVRVLYRLPIKFTLPI